MTRKLQYLSDITQGLDSAQLEVWNETFKQAGKVLDLLAAQLEKQIIEERKHMRLDKMMKSTNPVNELLARQAKIEALEDVINLVIDK